MEFVKMQRYESYKDSGVDWIGEIPSDWSIRPGLLAFSENKRNNKGMKENTVLSLSYGNIIVKPIEKLVGLVPESFETYQIVEPGDIIIRCTDLQNDQTSLRTGLAKNRGIITSAYLNLKVKKDFDSRFLHYYLHSADTTKIIYKFGSGLRQNLSFLDFKRFPVFDIPKSLQIAIVNFLDQKTAQIDEAIAIKERQIELLKERKQIIIQKAVTQGLSPNVPMKDSGVEWIGKVPEHWEVKRIKHIGKIINGYAFPSEDFRESGVKVMKISNIQTMNVDWSDSSYVDEFWLKKCKQFQVFKNDLVFALTRPIISTGIKAAIINTDEPILLNQRNAVFRPNQMCAINWLYYIILNRDFIGTFEMKIDITGQQPNISTVSISNLSIPVPPRHEQLTLCEFIDERCKEIDSLISGAISQIEKLKEYKTTLINSAVTGKIRVVAND